MSTEWQFLIAFNERLGPLKNPHEIQDTAVRLIGEHLGANRVHYAEIVGDEFIIHRSYVRGVEPLPGRGPLARFGAPIVAACRRGETVVVHDVQADPRFSETLRREFGAAETAAYIAVPLIKDGTWVATFAVHSAIPRNWTSDQIALVELSGQRTWSAAERARAEEALGRNDNRRAFLRRLNDTIRPLADPSRILAETCHLLGQHLRVNRVGYGEIDGPDCVMVGEYVDGLPPQPTRFRWDAFGGSRTDEILKSEILWVNDTAAESHTAEERAALQAAGVGAYIAPLLVKDGRFVAAFGIHNRAPRVWTSDEIDLVREVADRTWATVERCRAEAELRLREHRFRLALEASGGGSWTWDAGTNQVDWDPAFRALFGFDPNETPSFEAWIGRVHADDRPRMLAELDEVMRARSTWDNTYRIVLPGGAELWIQSLGRADRDADGRIARLTGLELDVTERRRTEDAQQARRDEEHNRELRLLLETATQGILEVDAKGSIVTANRALEAMFGWAPGDLIGEPVERLISSPLQDRHRQHRADYFAAPRPRPMGGGLRLIGERKDGSTFPVEVNLNHVATGSGGRAIAFVTDTTERDRAASALQERSAELERRTTQLRQMAWDLTLAEHHAREQIARTLHDGLQQQLVIASLDLDQQAKRDREAGLPTSELLSDAKHQIDDAIEAARSLHVELFPPALHRAGLPAALRWLGNWAHEKYKLAVTVNADPHADSTRKDIRTLVFESVRELLFNAFKHARAKHVTVNLAISGDYQLLVTVSDDGVGFESAALDHRSRTGQPGWGLFSIRERLALLGGHVDIESAPGVGTCIRLFAPRDAVPGGAATVSDPPATASRKLRIVIADDHTGFRNVIREILDRQPELSVVGEASDGGEAIAHARTLRPDVILMDVSMPRMDGLEATARIHKELPEIQVLGLSMEPRGDGPHPIEHAGASGYFVKNVDIQRLIDHLLLLHRVSSSPVEGA